MRSGPTPEFRADVCRARDHRHRPGTPPRSGGLFNLARIPGEIGDGLIAASIDAHLVDVFRGSGGHGKAQIGQLHISLATTLDEAVERAWEWWPVGAVASSVLTELARPRDFEAVAHGAARDAIREDHIGAMRREYLALGAERSNLRYGYVAGARAP